MSHISLVIFVFLVALLSAACANTVKFYSADGTLLREEKKTEVPCILDPSCNEVRQEYDDNGNVVATHSREGLNPFTLIFGSGGQSVSSARIGNAIAHSISSHGNIRDAIAKRVELGDNMTDAILGARSRYIAGSVGGNASASARVDFRKEEFIRSLSPENRRRYYGR